MTSLKNPAMTASGQTEGDELSISERYAVPDPNVSQRSASNPVSSVWVGASAGTGKTKVLTDRVLRLLLPDNNGKAGTMPHKILGITFTKAAASEMAIRINNILAKWVTASDKDLENSLSKLIGEKPNEHMMTEARKLFASVVDAPGGIKIMTIHSFCQSILSRFPLEAGIPPHFTVIEEARAFELLIQARNIILHQAQDPTATGHLAESIQNIAEQINQDQFMELINNMISERQQLSKLPQGYHQVLERYHQLLNIPAAQTLQTLKADFCDSDNFDIDALYHAHEALIQGGKTDQDKAVILKTWLDATPINRGKMLDTYFSLFLTQKNEVTKRLATKGAQSVLPNIIDVLTNEALRILEYMDAYNRHMLASLSTDLLATGQEILALYSDLKAQIAALDYDDLIIHTRDLLELPQIAPWIMYKLDGGLDHALIDEAQDTNPEQWKIIERLCDDFFNGMAKDDGRTDRTLFVVGDEKQSIYSFQRAAPKEFSRMKAFFAQKIKDAECHWTDETLNISFRSTKNVLDLVDSVFQPPYMRAGLGEDIAKHISFHDKRGGISEIWPLVTPDDKEDEENWTAPVTVRESKSPQSKLAENIGNQIKNWIDNKEILESQNRPIEAGDIMILVRTRTNFVNQLVRALKVRNIPVSGLDRMVISQELSIMDLCAFAQFALLPSDDLTLATILKSPIIGLNEEQLFDIAIDRNKPLWEVLREKPEHQDICEYLQQLIIQSKSDHPFDFFSRLLYSPCPADQISGKRAMLARLGQDIEDPIDEFLGQTLRYEQDHIATLQNFLISHQSNTSALKRELEESGNHVRIMTVHGAKGLQAPIVFLPDTTRTHSSRKSPRLLWPDKTGMELPLWTPRAAIAPHIYQDAAEKIEQYLDEEYRRLLYVAMTRAEDRLYIAGSKGAKEPIDDSWYNYIDSAFGRMTDVQNINIGGILNQSGDEEIQARRIYTPHVAIDESNQTEQTGTTTEITIADYFYHPAPKELQPPRPLVPSRPSEVEPASASPLDKNNSYRFLRGNITHALLQYLPDLPIAAREDAARLYISRTGQELPEHIRENVLQETLNVIHHPEYGILFAENSFAEVPITGLVGDQLVSAQIDRLVLTDDEIWIVDYKTNRPPPLSADKIPPIYVKQMSSYRDIVSKAYNHDNIHCYLLWTDGPRLMKVAL